MDDEHDIFMMLSLRDNILHTFFQILWEKCRSRKTLNNVRIPDTVIFSHSRVADWYFTSRDGTIRKKGHTKLSSANVMEQFEKRAKKNKSAVVALLLERDSSKEGGLKARHFDLVSVRQFLGEGGGSGMLQCFVEPKPDSGAVKNHEIALNWTPNVFYVEKKVNVCDISKESKGSMDERTTVDETAKNVQVSPLVSSRVTAELEAACQEIALHLEMVFHVKLASIGLHAKLDANDTLWILYCSSIRVISTSIPSRAVSVDLSGIRSDKSSNVKNDDAPHVSHANASGAPPAQSSTTKSVSQQSVTQRNQQSSNGPSGASSGQFLSSRQPSVSRPSVVSLRQGSIESCVSGSDSDAESPTKPSSHGLPSKQSLLRSLSSGRSGAAAAVDQGAVADSRDEGAAGSSSSSVCVVCLSQLVSDLDVRIIPKRHVLFPLSIIAFFSSHAPGTRYVDIVEGSRNPDAVPEFVRIVHPEMTLPEFLQVRRNHEWLSESLLLCDGCADGLRDVVASVRVEKDGSIVVPRAAPQSQRQKKSREDKSSVDAEA